MQARLAALVGGDARAVKPCRYEGIVAVPVEHDSYAVAAERQARNENYILGEVADGQYASVTCQEARQAKQHDAVQADGGGGKRPVSGPLRGEDQTEYQHYSGG